MIFNFDEKKVYYSFLSAIVTLTVGILTAWGVSANNCTSEKKILIQRSDNLQSEVNQLRALKMQSDLNFVSIEHELKRKYTQLQIIEDYIDAMPFPAWVKQYDEKNDTFKMLIINEAYERQYGITKEHYKNKTDFQVWQADVASEYYKNDLKVHSIKGVLKSTEIVDTKGNIQSLTVWKFSVKLPQDFFGVAGLVVDSTPAEAQESKNNVRDK